jgi:hypothetical protein
MSKRTPKRKESTTAVDPAKLAQQKTLARLRKQAAATLLKRRQRKSGQ